ncbi:hypothetical protein IMZ48_13260 [Candidatus Bathyarchaeota archaeon]|nr:hypothetical protein [Candidatus Bathyarchaeota archaeon]
MGKRSREAAAGETFPEGKSKKRKKDGKEPKEKKKRLRELQKDIVGLPEEEEEVQEEAVEDGEAEAVSKKAEKKEKKRKMKEEKKAAEAKEEEIKESEEATEAGAEEAKTKVSKGDAKNKVPKDDAKNKVPKDDADLEEEAAAAEGRKPRFIVFVGTFPSIFFSPPFPTRRAIANASPPPGNLPYSATAASIEAHFKPLHPTSIRCLNQRDDPTKCRGCAFVEFTSSKSIRTCLDKWHHSTFDDGVSKARKINVELTCVTLSPHFPPLLAPRVHGTLLGSFLRKRN